MPHLGPTCRVVGGQLESIHNDWRWESTRKKQQEQLERTLSRLEQEVERNAAVQAGTVLSVEDSSAVKQQATAQRALVKRLRQIKATGRIVLDANNGGAEYGLPDLPLENGDIFSVPPRPGVVSVYGSVFNQNSFLFRERYKAAQYISLAGGPTKNADAESLYILKANGIVISARQAKKGLFRKGLMSYPLMPGDAIVVPEDLHQFSVSRELKDWAQIFYQLSLGVAGLKVLSDL